MTISIFKDINVVAIHFSAKVCFFLLMFLSLNSGSSVLQMACDEANFSWIKRNVFLCNWTNAVFRTVRTLKCFSLDKKKSQQIEILDYDINSKKVLSERIIPSESKMCTKYLSLKNLRWYESEYYDHSKLFAFVVK